MMEFEADEAIRRLAEIDAEIEELTRLQKISQKIEEMEKEFGELTERLREYAKREDVEKMFKDFEASVRKHVDEEIGILREAEKEHMKRLAQIDAEIIDKLQKVERLVSRVRDLEMEIRKIRDLCEKFAKKEDLEALEKSLMDRVRELQVPEERVRELSKELKRIDEGLGAAVKKSDLIVFRRDIKKEEMAELQREIMGKIEELSKKVEDAVTQLAQIDSKIIDRIKAIEGFVERFTRYGRSE